ncbi:hypothetical protein [Methylorubrum extorquens]|uniref:Uncharacterized protein n=1 Tax=Methylorubrum extorquens DSM 13060 TaxID=882800 RepID=H1KC28_METEX|nr:hypothetical protein [Methylorubrum extorquens]EHP94845.1 hypothetical protein MetexDRAFT_0190 [Methylorubrum extorquens DSM 13060]
MDWPVTDPKLLAALERARNHVMTPAERHAQRRSWIIGEMGIEHPEMSREELERLADRAVGPEPQAAAIEPPADIRDRVTPEMLGAAWGAWHSRHGGKLGPGPAFAEAIAAALAVAPALPRTEGA